VTVNTPEGHPGEAGPRRSLFTAPDRLNAGPLHQILQAIRHRRVVFLVVVLLVAALALGLTLAQRSEYRATATMLVNGAEGGAQGGSRATATGRELLSLPSVAASASQSLGDISAESVADDVEVRGPDDADVLQATATADSPGQAARLANAYARAFVTFSGEGQVRNADRGTVSLVQEALPPDGATRGATEVVRNGLLGLAAGLLLGALLAWALDVTLTRRVRSVEELEEIYQLPVLAKIPRTRALARRAQMGDAAGQAVGFNEEAEAFRTLRTNLRYFNVDSQVRSILVASPLQGDGKSTIARHLAVTMASMGDSVCLIDADLRKRDPETMPGTEGLSLVLAGFDLETALTELPIAFDAVTEESRVLFRLANGPLPPNPSELLESARMRWVLGELERRFDVVIVDTPALGVVSDALTLVPAVSGVLIVSGIEQTTQQAALELRKQVSLLGGRPLGVVANFASRNRGYDYYDDDTYDGGRGRRSRRAPSTA